VAHGVITVAVNAAVDTTYFLERLQPGAIHTVRRISRVAGGKANNVARVLHLLGIPVMATGFAGGPPGTFLQEDLRRLGIATAFEPIASTTRTCLVLVDEASGALTEIREPGPEIRSHEAERFLQRYTELVAGARAVVLSGSLPPGLPTDFYAGLTRTAREAGAFVLLDCAGEALRQALPARPDLVKPNREELAAWAGGPLSGQADPLAAAGAMREQGASAVAVSLGEEGLLYLGPGGAWRCLPPPVTVVNTVGSGDSLVAGFLAAHLRGQPIAEALRLGVACGTANALTDSVASPQESDLRRLAPAVVIQPI